MERDAWHRCASGEEVGDGSHEHVLDDDDSDGDAIRLAVVRPFTDSQLELLVRRTEQWQLPFYTPCRIVNGDNKSDCHGAARPRRDAWSASRESDHHHRHHHDDGRRRRLTPPPPPSFDLIFYYSATAEAHAANDAYFRHRLLSVPPSPPSSSATCFRATRFLTHTLPHARADVHPDATCLAFYELFPRLSALNYTHFLLLEPDVQPIRPRWLDVHIRRLLPSSASSSFAASSAEPWITGSVSHHRDNFRDYHINGNALYALRDRAFTDEYLARVRRKYPRSARVPYADGCSGTAYGGFDVSLSQYLYDRRMTRDEWVYVQRVLHRFRVTDVLYNAAGHAHWRPWRVLRWHPATALVHGKMMNEVDDVWDPADLADENEALDVDGMAEFLEHWRGGDDDDDDGEATAEQCGETSTHRRDRSGNRDAHAAVLPPPAFLEWVRDNALLR